MFKDKYHPQVKKDLKALDKPVIKDIREKHILDIINNPFAGDALTGEFPEIYAYHFKKNGVDYRISYIIAKGDNIIFF